MKTIINPKFTQLKPFVDNLEHHFNASTEILHDERNQIRLVSYENENYVVKSFRVPNFINRIAYRYFRASKARRSYEYSLRIGEQFSPAAVAYIEDRAGGLLGKSFYISKQFADDFTIRPVLRDKTFNNRQLILEKMADFTYDLHQNNILHRDFSPGNILVRKSDNGEYQFNIVDVNRMQFKTLSIADRLSNFARLMADDETLDIIIARYAQLIDYPIDKAQQEAREYRDNTVKKRALKNKLRGRG